MFYNNSYFDKKEAYAYIYQDICIGVELLFTISKSNIRCLQISELINGAIIFDNNKNL